MSERKNKAKLAKNKKSAISIFICSSRENERERKKDR